MKNEELLCRVIAQPILHFSFKTVRKRAKLEASSIFIEHVLKVNSN